MHQWTLHRKRDEACDLEDVGAKGIDRVDLVLGTLDPPESRCILVARIFLKVFGRICSIAIVVECILEHLSQKATTLCDDALDSIY